MGRILLWALLALACERKGAQIEPVAVKPAAAIPAQIQAPMLRGMFALYCARDTPTRAALENLIRARSLQFRVADKLGDKPERLILSPEQSIAELPPPKPELMRYVSADLSDAEKQQVSAARGVRLLAFTAPTGNWARDLLDVEKLAGALAERSHCFIWDDSARMMYSTKSWQERRIAKLDPAAPKLSPQITLHEYRDGELFRVVSLGMQNAGLPDVAVEEIPGTITNDMARLINRVCDALAAHPGTRVHVDVDGRAADLDLVSAKPQEGDADNPLVTIVFPGSEGLPERQHRLLDRLFPPEPPKVTNAAADDAALLAARDRARAQLPSVRQHFQKGLAFGEALFLKVPVHVEGKVEWMWIELAGWQKGRVRGVLIDDSIYPSGPRAGAQVSAGEKEVFDYLLRRADGKIEGNETSKILEAREGKE